MRAFSYNKPIKTIALPDLVENAEGLTEMELEQVAGENQLSTQTNFRNQLCENAATEPFRRTSA